MLLVQNWPFYKLFMFQEIQARKMCFTILQNEKTFFQAIKTLSSKSRKIDIFPKGLTHGFGRKMTLFPTLFFKQYRPTKCLLRYCRTKRRLSRLLKREVQKVIKLTFLQRGQPMVLVQIWPFFQLFFLGNFGQENVFYDILERKNFFLDYENKNLKKSKN